MVLESIFNPSSAERHPAYMFLFGAGVSSLAIIVSYMIFASAVSMGLVFFTVLACAPFMYITLRREEDKDVKIKDESHLLVEHSKALRFLMFLFMGITVSCALWYFFLPDKMASHFFEMQIQTIDTVNSPATGQVIEKLQNVVMIFSNNSRVLLYCMVFSFVYGVGAIFIITWNASVIGTAIGNILKQSVVSVAEKVGTDKFIAYVVAMAYGFSRYAIHGLPEIAGYFVGGLAGGILSTAIINRHYKTGLFGKILADSAYLFLISVTIIMVSAILEVYVTPIFF
ncbi:stage II sporulation protein M [Candidatus Woesearchaeota archaeon]|nr:stage II sporulation protein M [Candidatus Woesearchaeota archaeon]